MDPDLEARVARVQASSGASAGATAAAVGEEDALPHELAILLHGVRQLFTRFDREALRPHGVDAAEYLVLSLLVMAGERGSSPSEMQGALQQTSGGMTRCLDRLERKGLVQRQESAWDRRVVRVVLTAQGRRRADTLMRARAARLRELFEPLGAATAPELRHQLCVVVAALELAVGEAS